MNSDPFSTVTTLCTDCQMYHERFNVADTKQPCFTLNSSRRCVLQRKPLHSSVPATPGGQQTVNLKSGIFGPIKPAHSQEADNWLVTNTWKALSPICRSFLPRSLHQNTNNRKNQKPLNATKIYPWRPKSYPMKILNHLRLVAETRRLMGISQRRTTSSQILTVPFVSMNPISTHTRTLTLTGTRTPTRTLTLTGTRTRAHTHTHTHLLHNKPVITSVRP
jgi:hypothetical protein